MIECRRFVPVCGPFQLPRDCVLVHSMLRLECVGIALLLSTWVVAIVFEDLGVGSLPERQERVSNGFVHKNTLHGQLKVFIGFMPRRV